MKKVLIVIAALIVIVAGALIYLGSNIDGIVKTGVEKYGPQYTGAAVRLGSVKSSLLGGEVTVNDFFLGNPQGFKTDHAFKVGKVHVAVDEGSLLSDVIHVKEIVIDSPDIMYELKGGSSNLQAIQNNVAKASGGGGKSSSSSGSGGGNGKKVIIDDLYVRNAKAAVSADMLGGKIVPLPLPDLHLKDIGKKSNGATMGEAASQVMDQITDAAKNAVGKIDLQGMSKMLNDAGKGAGDQMKGLGDQLKGLFGK